MCPQGCGVRHRILSLAPGPWGRVSGTGSLASGLWHRVADTLVSDVVGWMERPALVVGRCACPALDGVLGGHRCPATTSRG